MARQLGARSQLLVIPEVTYGTVPGGNWTKVPVLTYEVGVANDIVDDPALGFGHRQSLDPFRGPIDVKGPLSIPADLNNLPMWLKALLGSYSVTGVGPYVHTIKSEDTAGDLPSLSVELGHPDAGKFYAHAGLTLTKGTFDFTPTGVAKVSFDAIAQNETESNSSGGGTPTSQTYQPFNAIQGNIVIGSAGSTTPATAIGALIGGSLVLDNQCEAPYGVGTAGKIIGVDPSQFKATGSLKVRLADSTLYDDALNATFVSLGFSWTIDTNDKIVIVLPRVTIGRQTAKLTGPKGVDITFPFQAARDTGSSTTVIATVTNSVATY